MKINIGKRLDKLDSKVREEINIENEKLMKQVTLDKFDQNELEKSDLILSVIAVSYQKLDFLDKIKKQIQYNKVLKDGKKTV